MFDIGVFTNLEPDHMRYSAILLQIKDSKKWSEPVDTTIVGRLQEKALVKLIPAWEAQIDPVNWDDNPDSETFGEVTMYSFTELPVDGNFDARPGRIINVHPDRVIILAEGSDDGVMTSGKSLLEAGFNKLLDIEKVSGGASEGFLKNASRQLNFNFSAKTSFSQLARALGVSEAQLSEGLDNQVRRLNDSTDSAVIMQEGDTSVLSVAVADPEPTWRTALSECPLPGPHRQGSLRSLGSFPGPGGLSWSCFPYFQGQCPQHIIS